MERELEKLSVSHSQREKDLCLRWKLKLCVVVQELFKRVVPYHCLGSIWSQRDKKGKEHLAPTIRATVSQFNRVTNCVISTCLSDRTLKFSQRARILEHWIQVARVSLIT